MSVELTLLPKMALPREAQSHSVKPKNITALKLWGAPDPMASPIAPTSAILTFAPGPFRWG